MKEIKKILNNDFFKIDKNDLKDDFFKIINEDEKIIKIIEKYNLGKDDIIKNIHVFYKYIKLYKNKKIKKGFYAELVVDKKKCVFINIKPTEEYKYIDLFNEKVKLFTYLNTSTFLNSFNEISENENNFLYKYIFNKINDIERKKVYDSIIKIKQKIFNNNNFFQTYIFDSDNSFLMYLIVYLSYLNLNNNNTIIISSFIEVSNHFKYSCFNEKLRIINNLKRIDFLIIENICFDENNIFFKDNILSEIFSYRVNNNKKTVISTMYDIKQINKNISLDLLNILNLLKVHSDIIYL